MHHDLSGDSPCYHLLHNVSSQCGTKPIAGVLQALNDFRQRIQKYEEVYETITDRNLHYIKLIDMCVAHN